MTSTIKHKIEDKAHQTSEHKSPEGYHLAAIQKEPKAEFVVEDRPTPKPGPGEVLVEVHAVALNPVDHYMRDSDIIVKSWPATFGVDAAGVIIEAGAGIEGVQARPGTRVAAFCPYYYKPHSDYGAFQKKVLLPKECVAPLPPWCSFVEAAMLPLAALTAWNGWSVHNLPHDKPYTLEDKKAILIWGGSSSMGSMTIQVAKSMGYTIYTTATSHHHAYLKSLGAKHVFDYKKDNVVDEIIAAIRADGQTLTFAYDAVGAAQQCNAVIKALNSTGSTPFAYAPLPTAETERVDGVDFKFILSPDDEEERGKWVSFIFNDWLATVLENRSLIPSPHTKLVKAVLPSNKGLFALNDGLNELKNGVSGTKLVIEI